MIPRYSRPEMTAIWSPEMKFRIWFEIEAHAGCAGGAWGDSEGRSRDDIGSKDVAFDIDRIDEIEREVKHDVIAFLTHLGRASSARKRASCIRA